MVALQVSSFSIRGGLAECSRTPCVSSYTTRSSKTCAAQASDVQQQGSTAHSNRQHSTVARDALSSTSTASQFLRSAPRASSELRSASGHAAQLSAEATGLAQHRALSSLASSELSSRAGIGATQKRSWWGRFQPRAALTTLLKSEESSTQEGCCLSFEGAAEASGLPTEVVMLAGGFTDGPGACPGEEGLATWWRYQGFRL